MQTGLLIDNIVFLEAYQYAGLGGAVTKSWTSVLTTRCARRKLNTAGMGVNAMEEFIAVRYSSRCGTIRSSMTGSASTMAIIATA